MLPSVERRRDERAEVSRSRSKWRIGSSAATLKLGPCRAVSSANGKRGHRKAARSPLLSNILLDELDRELERRGHRFVRYADDANIYVRSPRAGERVLASIERFLCHRLKLTVNRKKSQVAGAWKCDYLGYG